MKIDKRHLKLNKYDLALNNFASSTLHFYPYQNGEYFKINKTTYYDYLGSYYWQRKKARDSKREN